MSRQLELERSRSISHLLFEAGDDLVGVTLQKRDQLGYQFVIRGFPDFADTRTGTLLDMKKQARFAQASMVAELAFGAGPNRERS